MHKPWIFNFGKMKRWNRIIARRNADDVDVVISCISVLPFVIRNGLLASTNLRNWSRL